MISLYHLVSFLLHFKILNLIPELTNLLHHLLLSLLAVSIVARRWFPMWTLIIVRFILIISDNSIALGHELTPEGELVERIHDHSINLSVFLAPASLRTGKVVLSQAGFAVETRACFALGRVQDDTRAHHANKFSF